MSQDSFFQDKQILLLEKDTKTKNDRTWCFWERPNGQWDHITHKIWNRAFFKSDSLSQAFALIPYQYKMLRGIDFYSFIRKKLAECANIHFQQTTVVSIESLNGCAIVKTTASTYEGLHVFSSIFNIKEVTEQTNYPLLQQHFVGWFVKTSKPVFDPSTVGFMDFSIAQHGNTRFMYLLPLNAHEALLEYTLFSPDLLPRSEYEAGIESYISEMGITDYQIVEKEEGNIPMTSFPFWKKNTHNLLHIGTAGGWTKASTGFTFMNTLRQTDRLVSFLKTERPLHTFHKKNRFWFYDLLFIDVLHKDNSLGAKLFSELFKKNKPAVIFRFLEETSNFGEELKLMFSLPKKPFLTALWRRLF